MRDGNDSLFSINLAASSSTAGRGLTSSGSRSPWGWCSGALPGLTLQPAFGHAGHLHCLLQGLAPEILHGSHLSFFLQSLMASMMVILHPAVVPLHVQQVRGVGRGAQLPLHLPHPGQLLMKSLLLMLAGEGRYSFFSIFELSDSGADVGHGGRLKGDPWQGENAGVRGM